MYIVTGYDGFIGKNFLKRTSIKKNKILKIKRKLNILKKIRNKNLVIINFAALYQKQTYSNDIFNITNSNLIYPVKIIQTLLEQNNKIVFFNIASYFQLKENFKIKSNIYSAIKNSFIQMLEFFKKKHDLKYFNIYLYDVFGHGDKRDKIFNAIINCHKKNKVLKIQSPKNLIAPIFIKDVCNVINKYILNKKRAKEIHINSGKIISLQKLSVIAKSVLINLQIKLLKNEKKDYLKIYKLKKYKISKNLESTLKDFFKEYV